MAEEQTPYSIEQFDDESLQVIQKSKDYDSGATSLLESYNKLNEEDQKQAAPILKEKMEGLTYYLKEPYFDPKETIGLTVEPFETPDPNATKDETVDSIDAWEEKNLEALYEDQSPQYQSMVPKLERSIKMMASTARRDVYGGRGEGIIPFLQDKAYRVAQGAVGLPAEALRFPEVNNYLTEGTDPERDNTLTSGLVGLGGQMIGGAASALAGGALGVAAYVGAQAIGAGRQKFNQSIEETGNEQDSLNAAAIETVAQGIESTPIGRGVTGAIERTVSGAAKIAAKKAPGSLGTAGIRGTGYAGRAAEGASGEAVSQVLSNVATGVGRNEDIDYTEGVGQAALLGGIASVGPAAAGDAYLEYQNRQKNKELTKSLDGLREAAKAKTKEIEEAVRAADPTFMAAYDREQSGEVLPYKANTKASENISRDYKSVASDHLFGEVKDGVDGSIFDSKTTRLWEQYDALERIEQQKAIDSDYTISEDVKESIRAQIEESLAEQDIHHARSPSEGEAIDIVSPEYRKQLTERVPTRFANQLAKLLKVDIETTDKLPGSLSTYSKGDHKIKLIRALGADPVLLSDIVSHEIGHAIDPAVGKRYDPKNPAAYELRERLHSLKVGLSGWVQNPVNAANPNYQKITDMVREQAKQFSMQWRKGWDGSFDPYRSDSKEIMADVMSGLIADPNFVKKVAPTVYQVFEKGVAKDPIFSQTWDQILKFQNDPHAFQEFLVQQRLNERRQQFEIDKAERKRKLAEKKSTKQKFIDIMNSFTQEIFDAKSPLHKIAQKLKGMDRAEAERTLEELHVMAAGYINADIERKLLEPLNVIMQNLKELNIPATTFAQHLAVKNLQEGTTVTIENIRKDPQPYFSLVDYLLNADVRYTPEGSNVPVKVNFDHNGTLAKALETRNTELLIQGFAQSGIAKFSDTPFTLADFYTKYPDTEKGRDLAEADYKNKLFQLGARNESAADKAITETFKSDVRRDKTGKLQSYANILDEVLSPESFNVRRFLINNNFENQHSAEEQLNYQTEGFSPEQLTGLTKANKDFHDALSSMLPTFNEAGIYDPNLMRRMELNKESFVSAIVLKYYRADPKFSANLKSAYGSMEETGDEITSTVRQAIASYYRAKQQIAQNSLTNMAVRYANAEPVEHTGNAFQWAEQGNHISKDGEGYLVRTVDGVATVYKVPDISWANIIRKSKVQDQPWIKMIGDASDAFQKIFLFKPLKTVLNPAFMLRQKVLDHFNETARSGSFFYDGEVRKYNALAKDFIELVANGTEPAVIKEKYPEFYEAVFDKNMASDQVGLNLDEDYISTIEAVGEMYGSEWDGGQVKGRFDTWQDQIIKGLDKVTFGGADAIATKAGKDELKTKLVGYQIGIALGKSPAEARNFARLRFGTPDPMGGGRQSPIFNKTLSFGRAYLNGLRNVANMFEDAKGFKGNAIFFTHVVAPRILSSPLIMPMIVGAMFGEEAKTIYQEMLNRIPGYDRYAKIVVPIGFVDQKGQFRWPSEATGSEINAKWKTAYLGIPQSREHSTLSMAFWPWIEQTMGDAIKGDPHVNVSTAFGGATGALSGSLTPLLEIVWNATEMAGGNNPTDLWRKKPIMNPDVFKAGSLADKAWEYASYKGSQLIPGANTDMFQVNAYEEKQGLDYALNLPVVGNIFKSGVRISNYGLWEVAKGKQEDKEEFNAAVKLGLGDATRLAIKESSNVSTFDFLKPGGQGKKGERKGLPADEQARYKRISKWKNGTYRKQVNEIKRFTEMGDFDRVKRLTESLERATKAARLFPENSSAATEFEED